MKLPAPLGYLVRIYGSWYNWLVTIAAAAIYYEIFQYLLYVSSKGIVILEVPLSLVAGLDTSASVLITLGFYSFSRALGSRQKSLTGASSGALSTLSVIVAGVSVSCACQAPIIYSLLYFLGLNSLEASTIVVELNDYQDQIIWLLILLNIVTITLTLIRFSRSATLSNDSFKTTPNQNLHKKEN